MVQQTRKEEEWILEFTNHFQQPKAKMKDDYNIYNI